MKKMIYVSIILSLFLSCVSDDKTKESDKSRITTVDDEPSITNMEFEEDPPQISLSPPSPKASEEKEQIQKKLTLESSFLQLGCCQDESKRGKPCCCEAILKEYATLYERYAEMNPKKIEALSTTDPLLGKCKKIMRTAFEAIDNPPPPKDSTDNFDDLF